MSREVPILAPGAGPAELERREAVLHALALAPEPPGGAALAALRYEQRRLALCLEEAPVESEGVAPRLERVLGREALAVPGGVALDATRGLAACADPEAGRVVLLGLDGASPRTLPGAYARPADVALGQGGRFFVADPGSGALAAATPQAALWTLSLAGLPGVPEGLHLASALIVDGGALLVHVHDAAERRTAQQRLPLPADPAAPPRAALAGPLDFGWALALAPLPGGGAALLDNAPRVLRLLRPGAPPEALARPDLPRPMSAVRAVPGGWLGVSPGHLHLLAPDGAPRARASVTDLTGAPRPCLAALDAAPAPDGSVLALAADRATQSLLLIRLP